METPDQLFTLACRGGLFDSLSLAVEDMTRLVARLYGLPEEDAYVFCTVVGSARLAGSLSRRGPTEECCLVGLGVPKVTAPPPAP